MNEKNSNQLTLPTNDIVLKFIPRVGEVGMDDEYHRRKVRLLELENELLKFEIGDYGK